MRFKLTQNPISSVPRQNVEKVSNRVLSEIELATLLSDVQAERFSPLTKFAILLCLYSGGQRPFEIINTRFEWVDLASRSWTMSEKITKDKKEHVIPMSTQLITLVQESRLFTSQSPFLICKRLDPSKPMPTSITTNTIIGTRSLRFCVIGEIFWTH